MQCKAWRHFGCRRIAYRGGVAWIAKQHGAGIVKSVHVVVKTCALRVS